MPPEAPSPVGLRVAFSVAGLRGAVGWILTSNSFAILFVVCLFVEDFLSRRFGNEAVSSKCILDQPRSRFARLFKDK